MPLYSEHLSENIPNKWTINKLSGDDQALIVTPEKYLQQKIDNLALACKNYNMMVSSEKNGSYDHCQIRNLSEDLPGQSAFVTSKAFHLPV